MQKPASRRICFIPGCPSQVGQVIFLSAYKSDGLQRWWSESAWSKQRKNSTIPKNTRVCEKHFEEKYIDRSYKMPRLFPDAWPTLNLIEPTSEELSKYRIDGRGRPPREVKLEFNPKAFCRLCGRKEKRSLELQLDHLKDGEGVLKFCMGQYYQREDLPRGVCLTCMESAESFVDFVKTCEEAQQKLDAIFSSDEALKMEPHCELLESMNWKEEKIEESMEEMPEEQYQTEYLIEIVEDPENKIPEVKSEEVTDIREENENDFSAMDDGPDQNSDSSHQDEDFDDNEDIRKSPNYDIRSSSSSFSNSDTDSDDEPLAKKKQPKKRCGPKPRQTIKIREDLGTLDVVDEFPVMKKKEKKKPTPAQRQERKGRKSSTGPGETSRICPICGKTLVHKGNFTSHLKIHSEKKDYVCNICGKQYYIRRELQMHIESLHEKKTFVCNICGIKCAWRKGLQRHMKNKHSDESSLKHKCTYCGKAFLLPNQLRLHVMKHTGDRITCEICGAGYRFNYMLTQHKIREHGMEFKGVKLYKPSGRSRKTAPIKPEVDVTALAVDSIAPQVTASTPIHGLEPSSVHSVGHVSSHVLEPSHDSIHSSESSQSHPIQQQHHQQQPLHYQHPIAAAHSERVHYPPGFVYPGGGPLTMMLPPGGYHE
ncbi:zinc finger and SCAN domain-containing protein 21-like [Armigeres subalbatus]|uniref:zinc finger and SCAN domain-containing protein 21-like n=1 Tax=Armigeres subalbatus TaxID=124917 RepID=UPI002ED54DA2